MATNKCNILVIYNRRKYYLAKICRLSETILDIGQRCQRCVNDDVSTMSTMCQRCQRCYLVTHYFLRNVYRPSNLLPFPSTPSLLLVQLRQSVDFDLKFLLTDIIKMTIYCVHLQLCVVFNIFLFLFCEIYSL